jgi:hypothetical protein
MRHGRWKSDLVAFCRFFTACVRAAQSIMFNATFRAGKKVTETQFHDALEERLRHDPDLEGRLTRRDPIAGGFDDLHHDDVVAELKVEKTTPRTVGDCARYIGQPTQYGRRRSWEPPLDPGRSGPREEDRAARGSREPRRVDVSRASRTRGPRAIRHAWASSSSTPIGPFQAPGHGAVSRLVTRAGHGAA